jgi:hypothetical protein
LSTVRLSFLLFDIEMTLVSPLLRSLKLPPVSAIPDVHTKLKELAAFGALNLTKYRVSCGPRCRILKHFKRTIAINENEASAANLNNKSPYNAT